jgi:hypothetical protein
MPATPVIASAGSIAIAVIGCVMLAALIYLAASAIIRTAHERDNQRSTGRRG